METNQLIILSQLTFITVSVQIGRPETSIRANVKIPYLKARMSGVGGAGGVALTKSKMLTKASVESGASINTDVAIDMGDIGVDVDAKTPSFSKFGVKVLPDLKLKNQKTAKVRHLTQFVKLIYSN